MIRLSTTLLEQFRKLCEEAYVSEKDILDSILHQGVPSWQMLAGRAFHRAMEGQPYDAIEEACTPPIVRYGDYWFDTNQLKDAKSLLPANAWVKEFKRTAIVADVELVAKADLMAGLDIHDYKARFSPVGAMDYEADLQWRAYLHVHKARSFTYHLFEFYRPDGGNFLKLHNYHTFTYWPYQELANDLTGWINRFKAWAANHNLLPLLEKKNEQSASA